MTATHPYTSCLLEPTARRRIGMLALATVVALAIGAGLGASTSRADVGSVYFDDSDAAAGGTLFPNGVGGGGNVGLAPVVMPNLGSGAVRNTAIGTIALISNTTGNDNAAIGNSALVNNTTGNNNVATGSSALFNNTRGSDNTAIGTFALDANTSGSANLALGFKAGQNLTTGDGNIAIANAGVAGESGTIRIGDPANQTAAYIAGISGTTLDGSAAPVAVDENGQLGVHTGLTDSVDSLAATVERLEAQVKRHERQIKRLRRQVRGG